MAPAWISATRTVAIVPLVLLWSALIATFAIISSVGDRDGSRVNAMQILFSRGVLFLSGVRLVVSGRERVPAGGMILMANHRSHFDVPALIAALPELQLRWVAKKELGRIPIFGWSMRAAGHVLVDRRNRAKAIESLVRARHALARGRAMVVFPEGTRSLDARLLPFKKGGFHLAAQTALPIVPVAVTGSERILAKRTRVIRPGVIRVEVLEPVPTRSDSVPADLSDLVRARLERSLAG